jgi:hypothetical protein
MKLLTQALIVGTIAAFAVFISNTFELISWALFLSWACYFIFGPQMRDSILAYLQILIGVGIGVGLITTTIAFEPHLGEWTLIILVFFLAGGLTFMELVEPFNNIPAYYVGMIIVFASGLVPNIETVSQLTLPITIGFSLGWITVTFRKWVIIKQEEVI